MSGVDVKCRLNPGEVKVLERRGRDALYRELKHDAALEAEAVSALGQEARRADIANSSASAVLCNFGNYLVQSKKWHKNPAVARHRPHPRAVENASR